MIKQNVDLYDYAEGVSETNPLYARVDLYDTPEHYRHVGEKPYATAIVGIRHVFDMDESGMGYVGEVLSVEATSPSLYRRPPVENMTLCLSEGNFLAELVDQHDAKLQKKYEEVQRMYAEAPWEVRGCLYSDTPVYMSYDKSHKFPHYDSLEETSSVWNLANERLQDGRPIRSMDEAEQWLLENHPDFLMGSCITQVGVPSPSFRASAVPCPEYPEGCYESYEGRRDYALRVAARLGMSDIGAEKAEDVLARLSQQKEAQQQQVSVPETRPVPNVAGIGGVSDGKGPDEFGL